MNLVLTLEIVQVILAVLLTFAILIQYKGKGLTSSIGSSFAFYGSRRGMEKIVFGLTVALAVGIVLNSIVLLMFPK
jgi:preprotein translocase subunit SecG